MRKRHEMSNFRRPRIEGAVAFFDLPRGAVAVVDLADLPLVDVGRNWSLVASRGRNYASRHVVVDGVEKTISMHRAIMQPPPGMAVDHIDGDGLNNRRSNLRICLNGDNVRNRRCPTKNKCGRMGVAATPSGKWKASIRGKHIGTFPEMEQAADAYLREARKLYGDFAPSAELATLPPV